MLLNLDKMPVKLKSPKSRGIEIDSQPVKLLDFMLEVKLQAEFLDHFQKGLSGSFYKPFQKNKKGQIDAVAEDEKRKTELKYGSAIKEFDWKETLVGYHVTIEQGIFHEAIPLEACTISKFHFYINDGGLVNLRFKVTCKPNPVAMGLICSAVNDEAEITIRPPTPEEMDQMNLPQEYEHDDGDGEED